jgi:hypothetical protein
MGNLQLFFSLRLTDNVIFYSFKNILNVQLLKDPSDTILNPLEAVPDPSKIVKDPSETVEHRKETRQAR